jgi:hypothetical protein
LGERFKFVHFFLLPFFFFFLFVLFEVKNV